MRHTNHGALDYARLFIKNKLDFFWINIIAAGNNQILVAPDNLQIALIIDKTQITGDEKSIFTQFFTGFFRHVPIADKDIRAAHFDLTNRPISNARAGIRIGNF